MNVAAGLGVFLRVVEQNVHAAGKLRRVSQHEKAGLYVIGKRQPALKEDRLKRQARVQRRLAPVQPLARGRKPGLIASGKVEKAGDQRAHLRGRREDVCGKALPCFFTLRRLQELRVCEDDGKRRFELVRRVSHKLLLLPPRELHRPHRPSRQQHAQREEYRKASKANEDARADEAFERRLLGACVGKDVFFSVRRDGPEKAQMVGGQRTVVFPVCLRRKHQLAQKIFVGKIIEARCQRQ